MHTVFALLCFVVVIHWLIFPYPSGLLHWHCVNLTITPVPAKQPWWICINTSCEFIMNDCLTTTKQSTTKPCAYFLGYTVFARHYGPLDRYVNFQVAHAPGMPGTFSPPARVSDPDMHHGTCVTHVPWCMPGLPTSGFLWSRRRGKRSRHSRRMRNPQFYVYGKKPMGDELRPLVIIRHILIKPTHNNKPCEKKGLSHN